jgi:hypothetical protein
MTAYELAERLHARPSRGGWIARCPGPMHVRGDRNPSLSIGEGEGGRTVVHCFTGCRTEDICAALNLKLSHLFSQPGTVQRKPRIVHDAEKQIADLRSRLTPTDRERPVTVVYCNRENLDAGIAHALAVAVEGEIVQCVLEEQQ